MLSVSSEYWIAVLYYLCVLGMITRHILERIVALGDLFFSQWQSFHCVILNPLLCVPGVLCVETEEGPAARQPPGVSFCCICFVCNLCRSVYHCLHVLVHECVIFIRLRVSRGRHQPAQPVIGAADEYLLWCCWYFIADFWCLLCQMKIRYMTRRVV